MIATRRIPTFLRRYTDLPALLHMLGSKSISLLDPKYWDDENDAYYLSQYKNYRKLQTVLALCFSEAPETYHHWRVFSNGAAGICIFFNKKFLLDQLLVIPEITAREITYLSVNDLNRRKLTASELPFIKSAGYKPEAEFRVIYEDANCCRDSLKIPIDLECIKTIFLSPWLSTNIFESVKSAIRSIDGCVKLQISQSKLISDDAWKARAENLI